MSTGRSRAVASSISFHRRTGRSPSRSREASEGAGRRLEALEHRDEADIERREVAREQDEERVADLLGRRRMTLPGALDVEIEEPPLRVVDGEVALEGDARRETRGVERGEVGQEALVGRDLALDGRSRHVGEHAVVGVDAEVRGHPGPDPHELVEAVADDRLCALVGRSGRGRVRAIDLGGLRSRHARSSDQERGATGASFSRRTPATVAITRSMSVASIP